MQEKISEQKKRPVKRIRQPARPEQIVLTVPQTAVVLGKTERATWLDIYRNRLPYRRQGKRIFILRDELMAFIKNLPGCSLEQAIEQAGEVGR